MTYSHTLKGRVSRRHLYEAVITGQIKGLARRVEFLEGEKGS